MINEQITNGAALRQQGAIGRRDSAAAIPAALAGAASFAGSTCAATA
jgi:hypothetical protein